MHRYTTNWSYVIKLHLAAYKYICHIEYIFPDILFYITVLFNIFFDEKLIVLVISK